MASKIPAGGKRRLPPEVKFLINIPVKVDSVDETQTTCKDLLDNLLKEGFKEEDKKFMREKNNKEVLEDVAVIFGMNGKHTPELELVLEELKTSTFDCKIKYTIITYTWGRGGTIAKDVPEGKIPYQDIREYLKEKAAENKLVEELRGNDPRCLVYFSFVDSDTFKFNYIYSEYLQIVREELEKDSIPPTVMSTGYEIIHNREHFIASWLDRTIRAALAEVHPLLLYYPEPNFCVLVHDGLNKIEESFIKERRKKGEYNMEAPVLIRQVKKRDKFKAVFPEKNPIIITPPERFKLCGEGLRTNQSHLDGMNLAKGAMCNEILTQAQTYNKGGGPNKHSLERGVTGKNRGFIIDLLKCEDDNKFEELSKKNPFTIDGKEATILVEAIREAREYKNFVIDFNKKAY